MRYSFYALIILSLYHCESRSQIGLTNQKFTNQSPGRTQETLVLNSDSSYTCDLYYPKHGVHESYSGEWIVEDDKLYLFTSNFDRAYSIYKVMDTADGYDLKCQKWLNRPTVIRKRKRALRSKK